MGFLQEVRLSYQSITNRGTLPADLYEQAGELLLSSRRTLLLTGAGVSTRSGIPDFRSPGTGMWEWADPLEIASVWGVRAEPERFYRWLQPLAAKMRAAAPNPAHTGFARLQALGLLHAVVTQNIDDLHEQAGSQPVIHIHGAANSASCMDCHRAMEMTHFWQHLQGGVRVPTCPACGQIVKPDVVLFGEELPGGLLAQAQEEAMRAELVIVAGSRLEVLPAADLPLLAKRAGARLLILNDGPTCLDAHADLLLHEDVTVSVPRLVALCREA